MNINLNDPRITAYALGEMSESEKKEFEKALQTQPEVLEAIEEIRLASQMLVDTFAATEKNLELSAEGRKVVMDGHAKSTARPRRFQRSWAWMAPAMAAAALATVILTNPELVPMLKQATTKPTTVAISETKTDSTPPTAKLEGAANKGASLEGSKSEEAQPKTQAAAPYDMLAKSADTGRGQAKPAQPVDMTSGVVEKKRIEQLAGAPPSANSNQPAQMIAAPAAESAGGPHRSQVNVGSLKSKSLTFDATGSTSSQGFAGAAGAKAPAIMGRARHDGKNELDRPKKQAIRSSSPEKEARSVRDEAAPAKDDLNDGDYNTEAYNPIVDNPFLRVSENPLSTFSIDVDTASYTNMRRFLTQGQLPPKDSIRIEELINYFKYDYPKPATQHPFSVHLETATAPWATEHRLVRVAIQGKQFEAKKRPASNLVFLIDVSGSMEAQNKLPLLKSSFKAMVENLDENDRVAIVVYAGASGLVLQSTPTSKREEILGALDRLKAGGSTNGGAGIELAYKIAQDHFIKGGTNRVLLATDGDFNVGVTNNGSLIRLIQDKAKTGVFLTVLGFGMGNIKDATLEQIANKGNGHYVYIDSANEGRRVLVEQMGETLVTIAKDVKIQVEFNSAQVAGYRLIGYENRLLAKEDFNDDTKDAGEIGAGHSVTALYEIIPAGGKMSGGTVDALKYQKPKADAASSGSDEMLTVKLRYKKPDEDKSQLLEVSLKNEKRDFKSASSDMKFASAVAAFGMILRQSPHKGSTQLNFVKETVESNLRVRGTVDPARSELLDLIKKAAPLVP